MRTRECVCCCRGTAAKLTSRALRRPAPGSPVLCWQHGAATHVHVVVGIHVLVHQRQLIKRWKVLRWRRRQQQRSRDSREQQARAFRRQQAWASSIGWCGLACDSTLLQHAAWPHRSWQHRHCTESAGCLPRRGLNKPSWSQPHSTNAAAPTAHLSVGEAGGLHGWRTAQPLLYVCAKQQRRPSARLRSAAEHANCDSCCCVRAAGCCWWLGCGAVAGVKGLERQAARTLRARTHSIRHQRRRTTDRAARRGRGGRRALRRPAAGGWGVGAEAAMLSSSCRGTHNTHREQRGGGDVTVLEEGLKPASATGGAHSLRLCVSPTRASGIL
jgi:hypothetical protein